MRRTFALVHERSGIALATVVRAEGFWARGWGVIPWAELPPGRGLWLPGVASVHTCFVRFPLDLLFLDRDWKTVGMENSVPPWRLLTWVRGAQHTIELGAGTLAGRDIRPSDLWQLNEEKTTNRCLTT